MAIISKDSNDKPILDTKYRYMFPEGWDYLFLPLKGRFGKWWDPNTYEYYFWDDRNKKLVRETNDRRLFPGHHFRWEIGKGPSSNTSTSTSTSATSGTTSSADAIRSFTGLNLGTPRSTVALTSTYNFKWYLDNKDNLNKYLNLANYNNAIRNKNLKYSDFIKIKDFLNPAIYNPMNTDEDGNPNTISYGEYEDYIKNNKDDFYNKFNVDDDSWLSDLGKLYFTFFNKNNGLDKILSYNDHLRMLYGNDLAKDTGDDNSTAKLYFKDAPAYTADDRYKLARAYNKALQVGDYNTAKRLSLYMTKEGINHYGYHDHFDLNHLKRRWERTLSNGKKVGDFLDWIYEYSRDNNVSSEVLNNIVRNATKYNFDLTPRFWNNLGPEGATIRDAYARDHLPSFEQGGQIFNMLFV